MAPRKQKDVEHTTLRWKREYIDPDKKSELKKEDMEIDHVRCYPEGVHPAYIGYSRSETINLGNYESTKVGISISVPFVLPELTEAFEFAVRTVEKKLSQELQNIAEDYGLEDN